MAGADSARKNGRVRWQCGRLSRVLRFVVRVLVIYEPNRRGRRGKRSVGVRFNFAIIHPSKAVNRFGFWLIGTNQLVAQS